MSYCILIAHFLMTKIATARARQEQRSKDSGTLNSQSSCERINTICVFSPPLLFCWVLVSEFEMSAVLIHSLCPVYFYPLTPQCGSGQQQWEPIWSGVDITTRRMSVRLSAPVYQSWSKCPQLPCYQAPAASGDTGAHNALVTCHIIWVVSTSQSEARIQHIDQ